MLYSVFKLWIFKTGTGIKSINVYFLRQPKLEKGFSVIILSKFKTETGIKNSIYVCLVKN